MLEIRTEGLDKVVSGFLGLARRGAGFDKAAGEIRAEWTAMKKRAMYERRGVDGKIYRGNTKWTADAKGFNWPLRHTGKLWRGIKVDSKKAGRVWNLTLTHEDPEYLDFMVNIHHADDKAILVMPRKKKVLHWKVGAKSYFSRGHIVRHYKRAFWGIDSRMVNFADRQLYKRIFQAIQDAGLQ